MSHDAPDLPEGWVRAELGAIAECRLGKMLDAAKNRGELCPYLRNTNVQWGRFELSVIKNMRLEQDERERYSVREGDLIVCEGGEPGRCAVWRDDQEMYFQKALHRVRPHTGVSPDYLRWWLQLAATSGRLEEWITGSTIKHLPSRQLQRIPVPLAPADEQQRIARRLDAISARQRSASAHLRSAMRAVRALRAAVLAAACCGELTADWRDENPGQSVRGLLRELSAARTDALGRRVRDPVEIADDDLPRIPSSWAWVSVDALSVAVVDGVHKTPKYVDSGVPFITVRNLTAGPGISFDETKFITRADHEDFTRRTCPRRGDILISKDGTIGVTRAIRDDREFSIFVSVALVRPVRYELTDYLELALQAPQVQRQMTGVGSGLMHLVLRDLKADGIPLPPLAEQREIVRRVSAMFEVVERLSRQIAHVTANLDRCQAAANARAFRGELVRTEASLAAEDGRDVETAEELLLRVEADRTASSS